MQMAASLPPRRRVPSQSRRPWPGSCKGGHVPCTFSLRNGDLTYNTASFTGELVIDPTLDWATYYGGIGNDDVSAMAIDAGGNAYLTGSTVSITGIATTGAFQTMFGGFQDGFICKFDSTGALLWGTYFGGSGWDGLTAVVTDPASGGVYVGGYTESSGFGTPGVFQPLFGPVAEVNAILFKFDASGARTWCTYFGNYNEYIQSLALDTAGKIFAGIYCQSTGGMATAGAYQTSSGGGWEGMVAAFTPTGARLWSTYFGGTADDFGQAIATDGAGNVYFSGATSSSGLASAGAMQTAYGGGQDGFLARFSNTGTFQWCTYYGGSGGDTIVAHSR